MTHNQILYQIHIESTNLNDLTDDAKNLHALAKTRGVPLFNWQENHTHRPGITDNTAIAQHDLEDLAQDFADAGYRVDFNDGAHITIYDELTPCDRCNTKRTTTLNHTPPEAIERICEPCDTTANA